MKTFYVLLLVIIPHQCTQGSDVDCIDQACVCGTTYLLCQDLRPNASLTPLTIDLDTATEIPGGILPANLMQFFFTNNNVRNIQDDALDGSANTLETMSFVNCKLNNVPDAFLRLKALKYLTITDTFIKDWNSNSMISIGQSLVTLSLSNVGLSVWPSWLKQFPRLTDLSIENCLISSIPDDAFEIMARSLTGLNLNNNSLKAVPKAFSKLTAITTLHLEHNFISNVTWLPQITKLTYLDLTGNNISDAEELSNSIRPYGSSLITLQLDFNRLTSIPALHFIAQVTELDLGNNLISDPNSGTWPPNLYDVQMENNLLPFVPRTIRTLPTVTSLDLAFNVIRQITATDFPSTIYTIELQYNLLTELTDTSFPESSNIVTLQLNNNRISSVSASAFANVPHLSSLNLGGNRLLRLPLALAPLTHLETLDMKDNPGLLCTCVEKSLGKVIAPMSTYNVMGDCGEISIYKFFTELSADCPD